MNSGTTQPVFDGEVTGGSSSGDPAAPFQDLILNAPPGIADSIKSDLAFYTQWRDTDGGQFTPEQIESQIRADYKPPESVMKKVGQGLKNYFQPIARAGLGLGAGMAGILGGGAVDAARTLAAFTDTRQGIRNPADVPGAEAGLASVPASVAGAQNLVGPALNSPTEDAVLQGVLSAGLPIGGAAGTGAALLSRIGGGAGAGLTSSLAAQRGWSPFATWLAGMAGGLVGGIPGSGAVGGAARSMMGKMAPAETEAAYRSLGVEPTAAVMAEPASMANKSMHMLRHMAGGGKPVHSMAQQVSLGISDGLDNLVIKVGGGTGGSQMEAGAVIKSSAEQFLAKGRAAQQLAWGKFAQQVPLETPAPPTNLLTKSAELVTAEYEKLPMMRNPQVEQYYKEMVGQYYLEGGQGTTMDNLLKIRNNIGQDMGNAGSPGTVSPGYGALKQLYKAVNEDIEAALVTPAQKKAFAAANKVTRDFHADLEKVVQPILKLNPEEAYTYAMAQSPKGASRLKVIFSSLNPKQKQVFSSTVLERMGYSSTGIKPIAPEVFEPSKFLANLERVSPEAQDVLFKHWPADARKDLNNLALVARNSKAQGSNLGQSTTALATSWQKLAKGYMIGVGGGATAGLAAGGPVGMAAGAIKGTVAATAAPVIARMIGNALTSPRVFTWMMKQSTLPESMAASQVLSLKAMGERYGDVEAQRLAALYAEQLPPGELEAAAQLQSSGGSTITLEQ